MSAIASKRLGFCSNAIGAFETCGRVIDDQDIEMVELPMKANQKQFICGHCVNSLLSAKPQTQEPEKGPGSFKHKKGGARLSKGPAV